MTATRTYRVQLSPSWINAAGQFCSEGKLVDTRIIDAKTLPELLSAIKALVVQAGVDCRAYVQPCNTRSRPSVKFREWVTANLLHVTH